MDYRPRLLLSIPKAVLRYSNMSVMRQIIKRGGNAVGMQVLRCSTQYHSLCTQPP